jgi:CIC family chloride channel protein
MSVEISASKPTATHILGNGYEVIVKVMAGHYLLPGLLLLLVLKTLATSTPPG